MRFDRGLSVLLIGFGVGLAAACSDYAEPSETANADAAQDAKTPSEAGDASRFDALSESRRDIGIDAVTDASLDVAIDLVDAETDGPDDAVTDGADDAPADVLDDIDAGASDADTDMADAGTVDAGTADTRTADASTADTVTADTGTTDADATDADATDTGTADAGTADAGTADAGTADAGTADAGTADALRDAVEAGDVGPTPNVIFVTSTMYTGNLGGLNGADDKCRQRAQAAGLSGTFVALLSTSTVDAKSRLGTARGWVRTDGKPFADQQQDLFGDSARTYYPPRLDEFGNAVPVNTVVKSGTWIDGTRDPQGRYCSDWTSNGDGGHTDMIMGSASHGANGYIFNGWTGCVYSTRIYCIEISRTLRVDPPPPPQPRRTAFLSNQIFLPPNGMGDADGLCAVEASAASLPGTYKAFLATKQASAMSRFNLGGAPWVRVDGVVLATTASDFGAGNFIAPLNVMANGTQIGNWGVWTGSTGPSALGTSTCNDWNPIDPSTEKALTTTASSSSATWFSEQPCNWTYGRVYCLQE